MNTCFKLHPDDFDKSANEKFYEKMAEKGWLVTKRWANLSKFVKTEPQKLKFDIFYSENNYVTSEEKAKLNADSRAVIEVKSYVHVSYTQSNESRTPVLESNEDAAKAIISLKNKNSMLQSPVVLIFMALFLLNINTDFTYNAFASLPFFENIIFQIITMPELYIAMLILIIYISIVAMYERVKWKRAVAAFHNGNNPDDGISKKVLFIIGIFIIASSAVFCVFSAHSIIGKTVYEIPEISDGLYLDVHDFGIADKITEKGLRTEDEYIANKITHRNTASVHMLITQEYYETTGKNFIVYQDIIEYKSQKTALYAAKLFAPDNESAFEQYSYEGFEAVYTSSENLIAVTDNMVYRITCVTSDTILVPSVEQLLDAILRKQ